MKGGGLCKAATETQKSSAAYSRAKVQLQVSQCKFGLYARREAIISRLEGEEAPLPAACVLTCLLDAALLGDLDWMLQPCLNALARGQHTVGLGEGGVRAGTATQQGALPHGGQPMASGLSGEAGRMGAAAHEGCQSGRSGVQGVGSEVGAAEWELLPEPLKAAVIAALAGSQAQQGVAGMHVAQAAGLVALGLGLQRTLTAFLVCLDMGGLYAPVGD